MIDKLYNLTNKGLLKALSFILASAMFALILLKAQAFANIFGGKVPYLAVLAFYGMAILWIHGIGFEIRTRLWRTVFLPLIGYIIIIPSILLVLIK